MAVLADPGKRPLPHDSLGLLVVALAIHALELGRENLHLRLDRSAVPLITNVAAQLALEGAQLSLDLPAMLVARDHADTQRRRRRGRASTLPRWPAGDLFGTIVLPEGSVIGDGVVFPMRRQMSMIL